MNNEQEHKSPRESGEDSEDESEILEESPCGRWLKRREEVSVRKRPDSCIRLSFQINKRTSKIALGAFVSEKCWLTGICGDHFANFACPVHTACLALDYDVTGSMLGPFVLHRHTLQCLLARGD